MSAPLHRLADDPDAWRAWADAQLRPLDLNVRLLHSVVESGQRGYAEASPLAPRTGAGSDRWQETVISLRELTGWRPDEDDGLARTVHPSDRFCIVARTGVHGVGHFEGGVPTPKNGLGQILRDIIDEVPEQLSMLTTGLKPSSASLDKAREHWLLLTSYFQGVIYSEVSLPSARSGDKVAAYAKRIQLPPLDFDQDGYGEQLNQPRPGDDDDDQAPPAAVVEVEPI